MSEETKALNIFQRIHAITGELLGISKEGQAPRQLGAFAYIPIDLLIEKLQPLLLQQGVLVHLGELETHYHPAGNVKDACTEVKGIMIFTAVDNPKDCLVTQTYGQAAGRPGTAAGVAMSYAWKNGLLKTFFLTTNGEDPEAGRELGRQQEPSRSDPTHRTAPPSAAPSAGTTSPSSGRAPSPPNGTSWQPEVPTDPLLRQIHGLILDTIQENRWMLDQAGYEKLVQYATALSPEEIEMARRRGANVPACLSTLRELVGKPSWAEKARNRLQQNLEALRAQRREADPVARATEDGWERAPSGIFSTHGDLSWKDLARRDPQSLERIVRDAYQTVGNPAGDRSCLQRWTVQQIRALAALKQFNEESVP